MSDRRQFIPRPITDRAFWDAVRVDPGLADFVAHVEEVATLADPRPAPPSATDFLAAKRDNDRDILDNWWRLGRTTFSCLAMRRLLHGIDANDPDDTLLNWLWAMSTQPTWAVSAHLPGKDLPADDIAMDLAACEMAADLAEIVETLGPWMDSVSETLKQRVLWEIDRRCLVPYADPSTKCWWDNGSSNWSRRLRGQPARRNSGDVGNGATIPSGPSDARWTPSSRTVPRQRFYQARRMRRGHQLLDLRALLRVARPDTA